MGFDCTDPFPNIVVSLKISLQILSLSFLQIQANRYWENDAEIRSSGCDSNLLEDIAMQLIRGDVGSRLHVILGGGRANMRNVTVEDEAGEIGYRTDGLDLIQEYLEQKAQARAKYVWNAVKILIIHTTDACQYSFLSVDRFPFH